MVDFLKKKLNVQKRVNRVQCKFYFSSDLYFHLKHALRVCRIFNKRQTLYVLQFQTVYTAPTQYICMNLAQNKIFSSRFLVFVKIKILAYSLNIFLQFKYVFTEEQTYSIWFRVSFKISLSRGINGNEIHLIHKEQLFSKGSEELAYNIYVVQHVHVYIGLSIYIYIYIYVCVCVCIYIYRERERERDRERD